MDFTTQEKIIKESEDLLTGKYEIPEGVKAESEKTIISNDAYAISSMIESLIKVMRRIK